MTTRERMGISIVLSMLWAMFLWWVTDNRTIAIVMFLVVAIVAWGICGIMDSVPEEVE